MSEKLSAEMGVSGWRQSQHLRKRIKERVRNIARIASSQSPKMKAALPDAYGKLLERTEQLLERAKSLQKKAAKPKQDELVRDQAMQLLTWIELTPQVSETARRRVLLGETVPNSDKLFSLFETHTQLYRRGQAEKPMQFGRMAIVFEDAAGFICHYQLMPRETLDAEVIVEQTRRAQKNTKMSSRSCRLIAASTRPRMKPNYHGSSGTRAFHGNIRRSTPST